MDFPRRSTHREACAHSCFDSLRDERARCPDGQPLPPDGIFFKANAPGRYSSLLPEKSCLIIDPTRKSFETNKCSSKHLERMFKNHETFSRNTFSRTSLILPNASCGLALPASMIDWCLCLSQESTGSAKSSNSSHSVVRQSRGMVCQTSAFVVKRCKQHVKHM